MSDWRSYDPNIVGTAGDDQLTSFTYQGEVWPFWAADRIDAGAGADTVDGFYGADTLIGGAGDDVLTGGSGAAFPGQSDDDLFVYAFARDANASYEAFRGGSHPSDHAGDRAWAVYEDQAAARGFDTVIGYTEAGRALYGRPLGEDEAYTPLDGHDMLTDFDGGSGDRIRIDGIAAEDQSSFRDHLRFEGETLYFDETPLMTLQGVEAFDPGWIVFG